VRNCYKRFDELVGSLLKKVGPQHPFTIVLSDHGFGRHFGAICPNSYLRKWGYYRLNEKRKESLLEVKNYFRNSPSTVLRKTYDSAAKWKARMDRNRQSGQEHSSWADSTTALVSQRGRDIDWANTKVATIWAYKAAYLFVNVMGRSSQGMVRPGAEYESIVAELIAKFQDIRHTQTGEKLLVRVARGSDIYPRSRPDILLPDVVLIPQDHFGVSFSVSDAPPEVSNEGSHRHDGILMMNGLGLKRPAHNFSPSLIDIAPTMLHLLGLPIPTDMDGHVLAEILSDLPAVRYEEVDNQMAIETATEYNRQEAELIEQRLKGLGYVE
jgi:predicted AlkP superfamily phosphohydrolase/phosphomutase